MMAVKEFKKPQDSEARQAKAWLNGIPQEYRQQASEILSIASEKGYNPKPKQELMDGISSLLKKCENEPVLTDYLFGQMNRNVNLLPANSSITRYYEESIQNYLWAASAIRENESFDKGQLTREFFLRLFGTVGTMVDNDPKRMAGLVLNSVLTMPDFRPGMLEQISSAIQKTGNSELALKLFSAALKPGSFYTHSSDKREFDSAAVQERVDLVDFVAKNSGKQTAMALFFMEDLLSLYSPELGLLIKQIYKNEAEPARVIVALDSFGLGLSYNQALREEYADFFLMLSTFYLDGKKLAKSVGANHQDAEVCLNFAYGIATIGSEKSAELYKKTGMEYFMRYSKEVLSANYENLNGKNPEKPVLLAVMNKNDPNGAFYQEAARFDQLTKYYRLVIVEADTEDSAYKKTLEVFKKQGKIDTFIIGGHGTPGDILLGKEEEKGKLDLTDEAELEKLKPAFSNNPTVILLSCSTGQDEKAIGGVISRALGARLFAPKRPSSYTVYELENSGKIRSVNYSRAGTSEFMLGRIYSKPAL